MADEPDNALVLQTSNNPKELRRAAMLIAAGDSEADHKALRGALNSEVFLLKLNTEAEYDSDPNRLRLRHIMDQLENNQAPVARETILALINSPGYLKSGGRIDLLIQASAVVRPATPDLVAFWDKYCQPEDGFTPLTIEALTENGSKPALELLERKFTDPAHENDFKQSWMRSSILTHRNDTGLLQTCERMLAGGMPEELRGDLVDVLFDYKPGEWYRPAVSYNPPGLSSYTSSARAQMRRLGDYATQNLKLTRQQQEAIRNMLEQLEHARSAPP
jgi:hypothetical protein